MVDFQKLFSGFQKLKAGVLGDVMLDKYLWGHVERISPEAPVPVVSLEKKENRAGGAGNVALNCRSLGASVSILSVTGDDDDATILDNLFKKYRVNTRYMLKSKQRKTTNKTRIISRNQQMLRVDDESITSLEPEIEQAFIKKIAEYIRTEKPSLMIIEDYNKGVLTERVIEKTMSLCRRHNVMTAVDPKRKNFFSYKEADIFKPNLKEVKEALNLLSDDVTLSAMESIHAALSKNLHHAVSLITLSEKGIFYQQGKKAAIVPSHFRNIADVSGAGDTVIAVASLVFAATRNLHLMAEVANIAGGLVCEEAGTIPVSGEKLLLECELLLS